MANTKNKKNRILETVIVNGIKYVKDSLSSKALIAKMALKGGTVNLISGKIQSKKTVSKLYI